MEGSLDQTPKKGRPKAGKVSNGAGNGVSKKSIGDYLQQKRIERGVALNTISKNTKIPLSNLKRLEENSLHSLPNKIYVAGYVKSYSKYLGIDSEEGLLILNESYQLKSDSLPKHPSMEKIVQDTEYKGSQVSPFLFRNKLSLILTGLVVLSLFALTIVLIVDHSPSPTSTSAPAPQQKVTQATPAAPIPNPPPAEAVEEKSAKVEAPAPTPEATPTPEKKYSFIPLSYPLYALDKSMTEEEIADWLPEKVKNSLNADQQNVYIRTRKERAWLAYKTDSRPVRKLMLEAEQDILIRGKEVQLFLGNLGAVKVFLNNQPLKISSRSGVKSLVFPHEAHKKYVTPLFIHHPSGKSETSGEYRARLKEQATP